jgi:hypothetical protein
MKQIFILMVLMVNTAFAQSDITGMILDVSKLKLDAESTLGATPYRAKEHQVIKNYFVGIKEFATQIRDNSRTNRRFNSYLMGQDMAKFCSETLINIKDWNQIKTNCTRNRFFLCTEDVNEYPDSKKVFSETLPTDLLQIFKNTPECQ